MDEILLHILNGIRIFFNLRLPLSAFEALEALFQRTNSLVGNRSRVRPLVKLTNATERAFRI